jgi:hypothetical protein
MLHAGDSLAEAGIRKQAVSFPQAKDLIYPVEGGPAPARGGAVVAAYQDLVVRLGQRLELLGAELQDRYLVDQQPNPSAG